MPRIASCLAPDVLADHTPSMHALCIHTKSSRHSNALHPKQVTDKYLFAHASLLNASTHSCKISVASYVLMELDLGWQRLGSSRCCKINMDTSDLQGLAFKAFSVGKAMVKQGNLIYNSVDSLCHSLLSLFLCPLQTWM